MINFWRYLGGYLKIIIIGTESEKLLNEAAKNRIHIWGLRCNGGKIYGNISIKSFRLLRILKRGIDVKIKIEKKCGILFFTDRYKKRSGFIVGITAFFVVLYFFSQFIWIINIEGNTKISDSNILKSCSEIGIEEGILIRKINPQQNAQKLLLKRNDLAWASFNIEGCILNINLTEIKATDKSERKMPTNIKAAFNGKIEKINVKSGNVLVKRGEYVAKGDILVSGIVEKFGSTLFVHSDGEIIAITQHSFQEAQSVKEKILYTEKILSRNAIEIFKLRIPLYLGSVKGNYTIKKHVKNLRLLGKEIPIKYANKKYYIKNSKYKVFSYDEVVSILEEKIESRAKNSGFLEYNETERKVEENNGKISLKISYQCKENIAIEDKIILGQQN